MALCCTTGSQALQLMTAQLYSAGRHETCYERVTSAAISSGSNDLHAARSAGSVTIDSGHCQAQAATCNNNV